MTLDLWHLDLEIKMGHLYSSRSISALKCIGSSKSKIPSPSVHSGVSCKQWTTLPTVSGKSYPPTLFLIYAMFINLSNQFITFLKLKIWYLMCNVQHINVDKIFTNTLKEQRWKRPGTDNFIYSGFLWNTVTMCVIQFRICHYFFCIYILYLYSDIYAIVNKVMNLTIIPQSPLPWAVSRIVQYPESFSDPSP